MIHGSSGSAGNTLTERIRNELFELKDGTYREMQIRTIPTVEAKTIIGVRTPALRALAKRLAREGGAEAFLSELPHGYFEENQLHAFIVSEIKDFYECLSALEAFLPYVDNWATCDQMSPKVFAK